MKFFSLALVLLLFNTPFVNAETDSLDNYVNRLKQSKAIGGKETAFLSIGSDFLYGQEYFEAGNYSSAASYFASIVRTNKDHPYANYQLAISLLKQNEPEKTRIATEYLDNAFRVIPSLKQRFNKAFPGTVSNPPVNRSESNENGARRVGLEAYIDKIKNSRSSGGAETFMNSPGLDAFYGIEYFEKGEYQSAETNFSLSLSKAPSNPYVNYMNAIALTAQGKSVEGRSFLQKAVALDNTLQDQFLKEAPLAIKKWKKLQEDKIVKPTAASKVVYGGALVYGNYTCHQSVWNGPNSTPAYRFDYKGYFELKSDGTYRWLDDGATGRYKYNPTTGTITWLSGHLKSSAPKLSQYQTGTTTAQVTVSFTDSYRWECGCKKK